MMVLSKQRELRKKVLGALSVLGVCLLLPSLSCFRTHHWNTRDDKDLDILDESVIFQVCVLGGESITNRNYYLYSLKSSYSTRQSHNYTSDILLTN